MMDDLEQLANEEDDNQEISILHLSVLSQMLSQLKRRKPLLNNKNRKISKIQ